MAQDNKYDVDNEDYFSCDTGIGALKFRKRLEQLQSQSKKLENLQFQLLTIKNANYITILDTVCGVSIIQPQNKYKSSKEKKLNKNKRRKASDFRIVFNLFTENETQRAFSAKLNESFPNVSFSFWKDTFEANNLLLSLAFQLVETTYTLFRKSLNNKDFIFLMVGNHSSEMFDTYRLLDILQSMIVDLCTSLQIKKKKNQNYSQKNEERKMSLTAMLEILEEVFGGHSGDEIYPLNKTEFVTCMRVRIGMESVWRDETRQRLEHLFEKIIDATDEEDIDIIQSNHGKYKCLRFDNLISYFSPEIDGPNNNYYDSDDMNDNENNNQEIMEERLNEWNDIKLAVHKSPLSKRNKELREKENISASKYREKLNNIEKLINLLEEAVIFDESNKSNQNQNKNEQLFWRKKIFQHREFVRLYQDVILKETVEENNKMKLKIEKLVKLNKFSKKVQYEENEWFRKNQHLLQIEQQYYSVLKKQKNQQMTMKKCEKLIQQKDAQIYQLKTQLNELINIKKQQQQKQKNGNINNANNNSNNNNQNIIVHISKLKDEIAQKKLQIQNQLELMTSNINHQNRSVLYNKQEKIKHDRI